VKIAVIGGTKFIGPAIVEEFLEREHDVLVIHRGEVEREDMPDVPHAHLDRHDIPALRSALEAFAPDAVVDTVAYSRWEAESAVEAVAGRAHCTVLSSQDVYRAFHTLREGLPATDPVPLDESSPLRGRQQRYMFRGLTQVGSSNDANTYENLDVEEVYSDAGATLLRLPMVYGERDHMRREEFILRRVRAGRPRIPIGGGGFIWTRCWVRDAARAIRLATEDPTAGVFNIGEARTASIRQWAEQILAAAGSAAQLVTVPDDVLPEDMSLTAGSISQHVLTDSSRFRNRYGWSETAAEESVTTSVRWHLAHPPADDTDFGPDDRALAPSGGSR
jgi:nucleoside-diphosphate-sugar epimerase